MTIIFGVLGQINFAHGEYYMAGAFAAWWAIDQLDLPYIASIPACVADLVAVSVVIGYWSMQRLVDVSFDAGVVATLGVSLVLQNVVILLFGGSYKMFDSGWLEPVDVLGIDIAQQRLLILSSRWWCSARCSGWCGSRASARPCARCPRTSNAATCWASMCAGWCCSPSFIGTALAALSGVLTAPIVINLYGDMGETITLKSFAVIVMGGISNVPGTLLAGWLLGIMESLTAGYIGLQFRDSVAFALLVLVLMWRPYGFFNTKARY